MLEVEDNKIPWLTGRPVGYRSQGTQFLRTERWLQPLRHLHGPPPHLVMEDGHYECWSFICWYEPYCSWQRCNFIVYAEELKYCIFKFHVTSRWETLRYLQSNKRNVLYLNSNVSGPKLHMQVSKIRASCHQYNTNLGKFSILRKV